MASPFFSIVIPTRNRPQFILDTAISAIAQQFDSFEVILSDNSSDNATRDRLRASEHCGSITYIRPPQEILMPDHWEFATSHAKGEYVLVLTDRSVLKQGALAAICRAINEHGKSAIQVCSWRWSLFNDDLGYEFSGADNTGLLTSKVIRSTEVAATFIKPQESYLYALPRALNSCYSALIAEKIRAQHGRLFFPTSPDFTSAFLMLAHAEKVLYIDAPLFISRGLSSSTGGNAYRVSDPTYLEALGLEDWYRYVPIKAVLVENFLYEDFLAMQDMAGGGLKVEMDWVEYFARCYREILGKALSRPQIDLLQREWERALVSMDNVTQQQVKLQLQSMRLLRMRAAIQKLPLGEILMAAVRTLKTLSKSLMHTPTTVLKAAGFDLPGHANMRRINN